MRALSTAVAQVALGATLVLLGGRAMAAEPACPGSEQALEELRELKLERASRTTRFGFDPPAELIAGAVRKPARPQVEADGVIGHAVMLAELPVESLWMALNDEEHFIPGGYLPLVQSEVISGTTRSGERLVYQSFKRFGVGRWWVNRVWQNRELFEASQGRLWELVWEDVMADVNSSEPPLEGLIDGLKPIENSRGAWLLVSLGESCTLMEYFTDSNPGGMVSSAQRLFGGRTLKSTIEGMVEMARLDIPQPHEGAQFERPDGSVIER